MKKILVVDDDKNLLNFIRIHLNNEGYRVIVAEDGREALSLMKENSVDLAVVDVMMPFMNGLSLTKEIRKIYDIPIIILTAKGEIDDKEEGFSAGTDDYLVKPFESKELVFRIEALMRRYTAKSEAHTLKLGEVWINPLNYSINIGEKTFMLPLKEFELLHLLAKSPNQVFSREQLIEQVWGLSYEGDTRTIDVHIKRLRSRFKHMGDAFSIKTVRGVGYSLEVNE